MIAASAYPSGGNAQFDSKPSKANRLLVFEQPAAAGCNSAAGKPASTKNLNNLLANDGDEDREPQGEQPGLIQQLLNFFFSKLWGPATSDAEKLGWTYVYAEDGSLLAEYGEGSATTSGSAQYLWLPTANGPMPIAAVVNGQTYAVHSDHLNTPRKLTQANGQAVWQWAYSAFGDEQPTTAAKRFTSEMTNPTTGATSTPDVTFNLRYPGQYFDKETGLHYNYFRTYAPGTGRYTQGDPIGLDGGWNRFSYVGGNPLSKSDPLGLTETCSGTDCANPPFDPSPNGPTPGGGPKTPSSRNDNSASGALCERFEEKPFKKWICEKCVSAACSAGIVSSALCCGEAHRQCVIREKSESRDGAECAAQLMTCNAFGGRGSK
ncbi:RHS repeat-associated core domain-containing protein [Acidovorax sp. GW101-3H11]|uniref:RHS repeat domain-containing protein n=1 Tax=Acidovorax sp. GW101-3H11 TaxID=1813946 RepID=UPI0009EDC544|nr:RHS repeat-associated core domain-containing protein [Acidovorax sp. GW101-3H11]